MKKVVITGSRDWPASKAGLILEAFESLPFYGEPVEFHHGDCPYGGADIIGAEIAASLGWKVVPHPPIVREGWAYAKRNQEMVDLYPNAVVACFLSGSGNRGTQMTYNMAVANDLLIVRVDG